MALSRRGRSLTVLAATIVGVTLTANLGAWQLRRAAQKIGMQQRLDDASALPPIRGADLPPAPERLVVAERAVPLEASPDWPVGRRVHLRGQWVAPQAVYLDNRPMDNRVGFFLVMPLKLEGRPDAVLVQRGWLPRDANDRTHLLPVETPSGTVELDGRIAPPPGRLFEFAPSVAGTIRQNLDLPRFAAETGLRLEPGSVQQLDTPGAPADGLRRDWPPPAIDVQKHYGYAFQWFALCTLMAALHVWFQLVRPRLRRLRAG